MILVAGATGLLGHETCRLLLELRKPVRAMIRETSNPEVVSDLKRRGAEVIVADLKDRASLDVACREIDSIVSTATAIVSRQKGDSLESVDRLGQMNLIDAAQAAGVGRFVFISFNHQKAPVACALGEAKSAVEQHLIKSGMDYTIFRAAPFMEIWLSPHLGFDPARAKATIYGSGNNPISWISLVDVAAFAAASVDSSQAKNQILEIGGPEALSPLDVVHVFEETTGRSFNVQYVSEEALAAQRESATDSLQHSFASLMLYCAKGDRIDMSPALSRFSVPLTSIHDYARRITASH